MRDLVAGGLGRAAAGRFEDVTDLAEAGGQEAGGEGGEGGAAGGASPFAEDGGYNYREAGDTPPFPETLEAKSNDIGLKIWTPDLYPTAKRGDMEDEAKQSRMEYCKGMVEWMTTEASARKTWVWIPAATYERQEHELTFAMCIKPLRPQQVTDLRMWCPPSCRKDSAILRRAVQGLLAEGSVKQRVWGRGVILYVGDDPKLRGER